MTNLINRLDVKNRLARVRVHRKTLLIFTIIGFLLFTLPLAAFISVAGQPAEIKQETSRLSWEHQGTFDYLTILKPSQLYGNATATTPVTPRYPASVVQSLEFTFSFKPALRSNLSGRVDAILESPGFWTKPINLASGTNAGADLVLRFNVDPEYFNGVFDAIEKELGVSGQGRNFTLKATVDGAGEQFVQALSVNLSSAIQVDNNLRLSSPSGTGSFDYLLHIGSGTAVRDFPAALVNNLDFIYIFSPVKQGASQGSVSAVLENPGFWRQTIPLVRSTAASGDLILTFNFDPRRFQDMYTQLENETGVTSSPHTVTLQTDVTVAENELTQSLAVKLLSNTFEVDNRLQSATPVGTGSFSYIVRLLPNTVYNTLNIQVPDPGSTSGASNIILVPSGVSVAPVVTLKPNDTIFSNLIDRMDTTFRYRLTADKPLNNVVTITTVDAILESPKNWSKQYRLLESKNGGNFTINFPIDLTYYANLFGTFRSETGVSSDTNDLKIAVSVELLADTTEGKIDEVFTDTLTGTFKGSVLEWDKELTRTQSGAIKQTKNIPNQTGFFGMSVTEVKNLAIGPMVIFFVSCCFSLFLYVGSKSTALTETERLVVSIRKKYGERIVEADEGTPIEIRQVISVHSIADLVAVADGLGKPIIHHVTGIPLNPHIYFISDGVTRYEYLLKDSAIIK